MQGPNWAFLGLKRELRTWGVQNCPCMSRYLHLNPRYLPLNAIERFFLGHPVYLMKRNVFRIYLTFLSVCVLYFWVKFCRHGEVSSCCTTWRSQWGQVHSIMLLLFFCMGSKWCKNALKFFFSPWGGSPPYPFWVLLNPDGNIDPSSCPFLIMNPSLIKPEKRPPCQPKQQLIFLLFVNITFFCQAFLKSLTFYVQVSSIGIFEERF